LQIHPEVWRCSEIPAQAEGSIRANVAFPRNYLADTIRRNFKVSGKFGRAQAQFLKLVTENLSRVNRGACHIRSP